MVMVLGRGHADTSCFSAAIMAAAAWIDLTMFT
jgi:hypothetical protein